MTPKPVVRSPGSMPNILIGPIIAARSTSAPRGRTPAPRSTAARRGRAARPRRFSWRAWLIGSLGAAFVGALLYWATISFSRSSPVSSPAPRSVPEMPNACQHHRDAALVRGGDDLVVAHAAAGLDDAGGAGVAGRIEA